jgi:hypothetical protein
MALMLRAGLILILALGAGSLGGCREGISRDVAAMVLSVHGQVICGWEGRNDFRPIASGAEPGRGSVLRTSNDARVNLALLPGVRVQVSGNSEIKIEELKISKDGNETADAMRNRVARLRLNRGRITILCIRRGETASQFTINTQQATITTDSDCLFSLQSDGTKTRVTCVRGKVYASQDDRPTAAVDAGFFQEWPSGRSTAVSIVDEPPAQIETMKALEAEGQLIQSESASRKSRPF